MKRYLLVVLILFAEPCFGESFVCVGESAAGFDMSNDGAVTELKPSKWILKKNDSINTEPHIPDLE